MLPFDHKLTQNCPVSSDDEQVEELKRSDIPCILWGAGEVAEKVFDYLEKNNVKIKEVLVDTDQARFFHNIPSISRKELEKKYSKVNLIIGHNRYDYYNRIKKEIKNIENIYAFSSIFGWDENFDVSFINEHEKEISDAYFLGFDSKSRLAYEEYINARISKSPFYITSDCILDKFFKNSIIDAGENEVFMDIGACKGNMLGIFHKETHGKYKGIIALEPEKNNYAELERYADTSLHDVLTKKIGCWNEKTELGFVVDGTGRSNHIGQDEDNTIYIEVDKIDNIIADNRVTICNLFLQTGVKEMILGAEQLLRTQKPKLIVGIGLRKEHFFEIPKLIKEMNNGYHIYYRFFGALPSRFYILAV